MKKKQCFMNNVQILIIFVIYWPSTESLIKRCTCVNKLKNSGSRWTLNNNITRCPGRFELVGERMPAWEPACRLRAQLSNSKPRWERNAAMVKRRTWGQYSSLSLSPAHLSHTTTITLSRIKCERLYFYEEVCLFIIEVRHYVWLRSAYIYICMWLYNILLTGKNNVLFVFWSEFLNIRFFF